MWGARRRLGALAALLLAAGAQAYEPDLLFSGACDQLDYLNGLVFRFQGYTASDAPYYKATVAAQGNQYIYFDPDCSDAGGNPEGRWIVDSSEPSTVALNDLDEDGRCDYHARFITQERSQPPATATWRMHCGGSAMEDRFVTLAQVTTTSSTTSTTTVSSTTSSSTTNTGTSSTTTTSLTTSVTSTTGTDTTTTKTVSSTTVTSTTATTTTATRTTSTITSTTNTASTTTHTGTTTTRTTRTVTTVTATASETTTSTTVLTETVTSVTLTTTTTTVALRLEGACATKGFLNGLVFVQQGTTASGAPYFKARDREQYLYYDADCDADGTVGRWIIDASRPNVSRTTDLDMDGACNYHARLDSNETSGPPFMAQWFLYCDGGWEEVDLTLRLAAPDAATSTSVGPLSEAPEALRLTGACEAQAALNNVTFALQGRTASGAPFYAAEVAEGEMMYIYYDPSCNGNSDATARWIIDSDSPSLTAASDLDADGQCYYYARLDSESPGRPAEVATWHMSCGAAWQDVTLRLTAVDVGPPGPGANTTTAPPDGVITSGASRLGACTAALLAPLLAALCR